MKASHWLNGFFSAAVLVALGVVGYGLWLHDKDWILSGAMIGVFALIGFGISLEESSS